MFARFPTTAKGQLSHRQAIAQFTAIDQQLKGHLQQPLGCLKHRVLQAITTAAQLLEGALRPPLQPGFSLRPALKHRFGLGGLKAKATHPVVIQAIRQLLAQLPQQRPPQTGLPGAEFIAIRG